MVRRKDVRDKISIWEYGLFGLMRGESFPLSSSLQEEVYSAVCGNMGYACRSTVTASTWLTSPILPIHYLETGYIVYIFEQAIVIVSFKLQTTSYELSKVIKQTRYSFN